MIVSGSRYWNFAYGPLSGEMEEDPEGMANMRDLRNKMAWLKEPGLTG